MLFAVEEITLELGLELTGTKGVDASSGRPAACLRRKAAVGVSASATV
ncbi:hypothetical protein [Streptomyces sp. CL12-4]|nr:hypothetical protein [Streptomyces sp. CL12-4]MCG8971461.1 hypothetical protein [Streptomyces sp. CL12-4]